MENGNTQKLDLPTLLKLKDLDIRGVAEKGLLATEYFNVVFKFLEDAPAAIDSLLQISVANGSETDFEALENIKQLFPGIGYDKLAPVIDALLEAGGKGNKEFAEICAKRALADLNELYKRTATALRKRVKHDLNPDGVDKDFSLTLKEALAQADYDEANRKLRVLAVDDAAFMLKTISSVLRSEYEVFALTKSTMVEKFLQHTTPELFLLDFSMPELSGFELIPIIRGFEEHKDTPIIFLTAIGTAGHVAEAASLGACDYVVKPPDANILRSKIEKHIVRKKAF